MSCFPPSSIAQRTVLGYSCLVGILAACMGVGLLGTLGLEGLGLGTTSIRLLGELLLEDLLALGLVDVLHKHTLVLEHVTLHLHVQLVVHVLVDLLAVAVLLEETTEDTETAQPDHLLGKACTLATLALTSAGVTALALGNKFLPDAVPGVDLGRLLDDEAILGELPDIKPGVGHGDLVDFIWVEPDFALPALKHGRS